jgi:prevent-host-death family protein
MYTVHFAKTNLSKLLLQVEDGKQVVLARGKKPIARLVPCSQLPNEQRPEVGTVTSRPIKVNEKREISGSVGDTVVYF